MTKNGFIAVFIMLFRLPSGQNKEPHKSFYMADC